MNGILTKSILVDEFKGNVGKELFVKLVGRTLSRKKRKRGYFPSEIRDAAKQTFCNEYGESEKDVAKEMKERFDAISKCEYFVSPQKRGCCVRYDFNSDFMLRWFEVFSTAIQFYETFIRRKEFIFSGNSQRVYKELSKERAETLEKEAIEKLNFICEDDPVARRMMLEAPYSLFTFRGEQSRLEKVIRKIFADNGWKESEGIPLGTLYDKISTQGENYVLRKNREGSLLPILV